MYEAKKTLSKKEACMDSGIIRKQNEPQRRMMPLAHSLGELAKLGSPVDLSVAREEPLFCKVGIQQLGGIHESMIFELKDGRFGCMMDLELCNHTPRSIHHADMKLQLPWKSRDHSLEWLTPREIIAKNSRGATISRYQVYRFPGKNALELPAEDVINDAVVEKKMLPARRPVSGWLLAIGGLMPRHLFHGGWIDAVLVITASDHTELRKPIRLWTERLERKHRSTPRTVDLFGNRTIEGRVLENTLQSRRPKPAVAAERRVVGSVRFEGEPPHLR
jgi:hypothetical protein